MRVCLTVVYRPLLVRKAHMLTATIGWKPRYP